MNKRCGGIEKQVVWRRRFKIDRDQTMNICNFLTDGKYTDIANGAKRRAQKKKKQRVDEDEVDTSRPSSPIGDAFEGTRYHDATLQFSSQWTITEEELKDLQQHVNAEFQEKRRLIQEQEERERQIQELKQSISTSKKSLAELQKLLEREKVLATTSTNSTTSAVQNPPTTTTSSVNNTPTTTQQQPPVESNIPSSSSSTIPSASISATPSVGQPSTTAPSVLVPEPQAVTPVTTNTTSAQSQPYQQPPSNAPSQQQPYVTPKSNQSSSGGSPMSSPTLIDNPQQPHRSPYAQQPPHHNSRYQPAYDQRGVPSHHHEPMGPYNVGPPMHYPPPGYQYYMPPNQQQQQQQRRKR